MNKDDQFVRRELKYVVDAAKYRALLGAIVPYVHPDSFGDKAGFYKVSSLYFDTKDWDFYYESLDEAPFRQKLRLRVYNNATLNDTAFVEIKRKHMGEVNKRRAAMPLKEAYAYFRVSGSKPMVRSQVMKEALYIHRYFDLLPSLIITYERQAFTDGSTQNLRITFDRDIGFCRHNLSLEEFQSSAPVMPETYVLMEVKTDAAIPMWLSKILCDHSCVSQQFSKYVRGVQQVRGQELDVVGRETNVGRLH